MPKLLLPLVVALAIGGSAAGASVYLLTRDETVEEVLPPAVQATATTTPTAAPVTTPTATPTPSGVPTGWLTYTDPDFKFSFAYPPEFIVESTVVTGTLPPGWLLDLRAVDKRFTEGYPPGQVTFSAFVKDADNIEEWVSKHSTADVKGAVDGIFYYGVARVTSTEAAGRDAMSLDWNPGGEGDVTIHSLVFFSGSYVFEFHWYAHDPVYERTIRAIFDRTVLSFRD